MNPIECPIEHGEILEALLTGKFRHMREAEMKMLQLEYDAYIWQPLARITVILEHNPGGLRFRVTNGEQVWVANLDAFSQIG